MTILHRARLEARDRAIAIGSIPLSSRLVSDDSVRSHRFDRIIDQVEVVSFDVFDTVLVRPLVQPVDLFLLLGDAFGCSPLEARALRVRAESQATEAARRAGRGEVSLREIHDQIAAETGTDPVETSAREVLLERFACHPLEAARQRWDRLVEGGKRVVFTSDTYLPAEVVSDLLVAAGFGADPECIVSSAELLTKREGGLFEVLVERVATSPDRILHVGDTLTPDLLKPLRRGLRAGYVARPIDQLRRRFPFLGAQHGGTDLDVVLSNSIVVGALANHWVDRGRPPSLDETISSLRQAFQGVGLTGADLGWDAVLGRPSAKRLRQLCLAELDRIQGTCKMNLGKTP